jgi:hypothetical protein
MKKTATPELEPFEDDDCVMTIKKWMECCDAGGFIDYDGFGELATRKGHSDIAISPSQRKTMKIPKWATHVVWYNR